MYWWFWNRAKGLDLKNKDKRKKNDGGLDFNAAPKKAIKRQHYQAYIDVCGDRVLPVLRSEFQEYLKTVPQGEKPKAWVAFMGERGKAMLDEEPEEVKAQVEAARVKGPKDDGLDMFIDPAPGVTVNDQHKRAKNIQE